jgi:hypothetical protein
VGGDLSNPQSLNPYSYVLNNPLTLTDPTGACIPDYVGYRGCGLDPMRGSATPVVPIVTLEELVGGEFSAGWKIAIVSAGLCSLYCKDLGNSVGDIFGTLFSDGISEEELRKRRLRGRSMIQSPSGDLRRRRLLTQCQIAGR